MIDDEWKQETGLISGEGAVDAAAKKLRARFGLSCVRILKYKFSYCAILYIQCIHSVLITLKSTETSVKVYLIKYGRVL